MNDHSIKPFDVIICGIYVLYFFAADSNLSSNHATLGSKWKLNSKSGMNGHPIGPFDKIIEPLGSPMNSPGF